MKKKTKEFNALFYENVLKPIRSRQEYIILLLDTIKLFLMDETLPVSVCGKAYIVVDKMSRIFYETEEKIFSICFPFSVEFIGESVRIYDANAETEVDSKLVAIIRGILLKYDFDAATPEKLYDIYCEEMMDIDIETLETAWKVLMRLFTVEIGYIRYDCDLKHQDEIYHPLNHFDINFSNNVTYKLGLRKRIDTEEMIQILDIKDKCRYLEFV